MGNFNFDQNDPASIAPALMWMLLLALLTLPLLGAMVAALSGAFARRVALYFSLAHVIGTAVFVTLFFGFVAVDLRENGEPDRLAFKPKAVPGDPGVKGGSGSYSHRTGWSMLTLAPIVPPIEYLVSAADEGKLLADLMTRDKILGHDNISMIHRNFDEARISVNGDVRDKNFRVKSGDRVAISIFDPAAVPSDIQFYIGVDGISLPLVALTSLMIFLAILISWDTQTERPAGYYAWILVLESVLIGAFVSFDIILFYIFFELTLLPSFFLIGNWGLGGARRDAARKFVLYTLFGSLFTLVGIIGVVLNNPAPLHPVTGKVMYWDPLQESMNPNDVNGQYTMPKPGAITFSIPSLMQNSFAWDMAHTRSNQSAERRAGINKPEEPATELDNARSSRLQRRTVQSLLFFSLIFGFVIKLPLVPFHSWLPAAYAAAPLPITMLFSAVLAKLGAYGMIRIAIPLMPEAAATYGLPVFGTLGAIGIVYAALCAFAQKDLKMLAAYSSVSHLGFLAAGLFALNMEGLQGSILHMVNHGLTAGAMFALLAFLYRRYGTTEVEQFGGLWSKYPVYTFFVITICLASVGMPGLNSFVSEMLMLAGLFDTRNLKLAGYAIPVTAAIGIFLSAWYTFTMIRKVSFGPLREPNPVTHELTDLHGREQIPMIILAGLCLILGIYPQPLIGLISTDANRVSAVVDIARYRMDNTALPPMRINTNPPPVAQPMILQGQGRPGMAPMGGGAGRPGGQPPGNQPPGAPGGANPPAQPNDTK